MTSFASGRGGASFTDGCELHFDANGELEEFDPEICDVGHIASATTALAKLRTR